MCSSHLCSEILTIRSSLIAENVGCVAFYSHNNSRILAVVLSNSDIILWKVTVEKTNHVIKWIPWRNDANSRIQAVTFQYPCLESVSEDKIQLLAITYAGTIYILQINDIINGEPTQRSSTTFSLFPSCPINNFIPTAVVWWSSYHPKHKDVAIIGGNNGDIVFYSLSCAGYLASLNTGTKSPVFSLSTCSDFFRDYSYLLITNDLRQQWKLLLEKEVNGEAVVLIAFEENDSFRSEKNNDTRLRSQKSRLQEFKQISVETFALLKQKLNDTRKITNEKLPKIGMSMNVEASELQSCDCYGDAFLSVQQYRCRRVLTGLFIPEAVLLLYLQNKDSTTLIHHKFKISPLVTTLLLTHTFVYVADIMETQHRILVFSTRLSESKKSEPAEYNQACFIQSFLFPEDEQIINLFKMEVNFPINDTLKNTLASLNAELASSSQARTKIKQVQLEDEWNEACLVVTNKGVYIISLRNNPLQLALDSLKTDINLIKKLPFIFNIPLSKLIEFITEQLVEEQNVKEALLACNTFKCYSGKMTLKLANYGFIEELLQHAEYILNQSDLDLPLVERIHLSNFVVNCYAERYLRNPGCETWRKQFLNFLKENHYYDEEVNIHILGNYRLCSFVHFLCVWRGLYVDGTVALTNMIAQSQTDKYDTLHKFEGFWLLFSENSLVDAFLLSPRTVHLHIDFLRHYFKEIPDHIKKRLYHFYDPTQAVVKPAMCRMLRASREEYLEAYDLENDKWGCDANMFDWITNFLFLHIHVFNMHTFDKSLTRYVLTQLYPLTPSSEESIPKLTESHNSLSSPALSAGFAHAALVRNGSLITWGQSLNGCLGTGPTLSQNCPPMPNTWFDDHRIRVQQVSCGRQHTLALTENGVYAWGSSKFGQLGIGNVGQSAHPRMVDRLSSCIVCVAAGQYHSLAVDIFGKIWTWGWGVYGQLGHGNIDDEYYPKCVEKLQKTFITFACGGQAHSIVLSKSGKVFTFGCNTYGQLGIGTNSKSTTPVKVFGIQENIIMIATNYFHNLALSDSNRLYTWGCSPQILKLQAQTQRRAKSVPNFAEKTVDSIVHVDKLLDNGSELIDASVNVVEDNSVSYEPIPQQVDHARHLSPTLVDTSTVEGNIMQIACGLFHSVLLTTDSIIYTWGRNTDGQLGNSKRQAEISAPTPVNIYPIKLLANNKHHMDMLNRPIWRVSCGKDYTLAVELESRLFGWGNNSCGQLGTSPQEDFSIKRFLNGKFIVNKYAKRMIKLSHGGVNIIEKPTEITGIPRLQFVFTQEGTAPDRYRRMECNLHLPGFNQPHYVIQNTNSEVWTNINCLQKLHYYMECFHRYYNADFILQICVRCGNLQAAAKICHLNYRFYEAFFYSLKALLCYVREMCSFVSFKEDSNLANNSLVTTDTESNPLLEDIAVSNGTASEKLAFANAKDIIVEAISLLEIYYELTLKFTPERMGMFLRKSLSLWIVWELPVQQLEFFFSSRLNSAAFPLAVFLFSDRYKSLIPKNVQEINNSSHISSNWKDKNLYLSTSSNKQKNKSLSSKTIKYPFMNHETKACYGNLYQCKNDVNLEANDLKYELNSAELLRNLSVQFILKLCNVVVDSTSTKSPADYEEFIRLLHEIIFAPSILESDDRSPDEILSSVLNTLQKSQSPPKKFIQISYEELRDRTVEDKFIAFSCRHFFTSQADFEKEVKMVVRELDAVRLFHTSELVNRLFSECTFATCCPSCLFRCLENEINSLNGEA